MKLAVYLIDHNLGSETTNAALSQISEQNSSEMFLLSTSESTSHSNVSSMRFVPHGTIHRTPSDLHELVKLLLAHPLFCSRPGLTAPINVQMLSMLGLGDTTIETFREELMHHQAMIITDSTLLFEAHLPLNIRHTFCIRLHNNFQSMIKKTAATMIQIPMIARYTERLNNDFTF